MGKLFTKGVSGNPKGRPSTKALREALHPSEPMANKRLIELISHRSPKIALMAIAMFYDRLHGKPLAASEITLQDNRIQEPTPKLTASEIVAGMTEMMAKCEQEMGISPGVGSNEERMKRMLALNQPLPPTLYRLWQEQQSGTRH